MYQHVLSTDSDKPTMVIETVENGWSVRSVKCANTHTNTKVCMTANELATLVQDWAEELLVQQTLKS